MCETNWPQAGLRQNNDIDDTKRISQESLLIRTLSFEQRPNTTNEEQTHDRMAHEQQTRTKETQDTNDKMVDVDPAITWPELTEILV